MNSVPEIVTRPSLTGTAKRSRSIEAAIGAALDDAIQAPSTYNTQPWRFRLRNGAIEVLADRTRSLPVVDPYDRELVISCGAAIYQLRLGLRHEGLVSRVVLEPEATEPDLLARVHIMGRRPPTDDEMALHGMIRQRHSNHDRYLGMEVPFDVTSALTVAAINEGAHFVPLQNEGARTRLIALVMDGDHNQWDDERFRNEYADWVRPDGDSRADGVMGFRTSSLLLHLAPSLVRSFDLGETRAAKDRDLADGSPLLAVLATSGDTVVEWLRAGQALGRVLLVATVEGLAASFLDQPVEEPDLRENLNTLLPRPWFSQHVLRLGYAPPGPATPRRPLSEVMR